MFNQELEKNMTKEEYLNAKEIKFPAFKKDEYDFLGMTFSSYTDDCYYRHKLTKEVVCTSSYIGD